MAAHYISGGATLSPTTTIKSREKGEARSEERKRKRRRVWAAPTYGVVGARTKEKEQKPVVSGCACAGGEGRRKAFQNVCPSRVFMSVTRK